jgi:cyclopropane fatty-acyl-phospholipid synthase-like methyltransferase
MSERFMFDWYMRYYEATGHSRAYAEFCERVFGANFAQHGYADMAQVDALLAAARLGPESQALELGCGNGGIAEYVAAKTGARVTGIDFVPEAIRQAQERARRNPRLSFLEMDMAALSFARAPFDAVISIDTLYFVEPEAILTTLRTLLAPGGRLLALYSHGADPEHPLATFARDTLPPQRTALGVALLANGFAFESWDFTQADYRHAQLKKAVISELRPALEAEGNQFLYDNRYGEACGVITAVEAGAHARYLYRATPPEHDRRRA